MGDRASRKARGAFFTPDGISQYLVDWAIRTGDDLILEPSCGEASFIVPAVERLKELTAGSKIAGGVYGVEIDPPSAAHARELVSETCGAANIQVCDFFDYTNDRKFDAVIGNPPFIRYQSFSGASRAKSLAIALEQGVRLSGLASSWASFVVKSAYHLKPSGRLAMVLPAELLSVGYAAEVRRFLLATFQPNSPDCVRGASFS